MLDEPTSQLDPQGAEHVVAALQRLVHDQGMTVLLAEHRLERVAGFVDLALGFEVGAVVQGEPADVIRRLAMGLPVALGRLVGWDPVPLTVREARRLGGPLAPFQLPATAIQGTPSPATPERPSCGSPVSMPTTAGRRAARHRPRGGPREVVAVMGRNGAGKTTCRSIVGVHAPSRGSIEVDGHPPRPGVDVALCPQEPEVVLFAETVGDEVRATRKARELPDDPVPVLHALGIADLAAMHPATSRPGSACSSRPPRSRRRRRPCCCSTSRRGLDLVEGTTGGVPAFARRTWRRRDGGYPRRGARRRGRDPRRDPRRGRGDRRRRPRPRARRLDGVRAADDTRLGAGWLTPEQVAEALA